MKHSQLLYAVILSFIVGGFSILQAQVSSVIIRVNAPTVSQNQPLPVSIEYTPTANVQRVLFKYRSFGETEFKQQEMLVAGNSASVTLGAQYVVPPYIEYYIEVQMDGDKKETYPLENPEMNPLKATIKPIDPKNLEVRILSPEAGEMVSSEDLVIAVSLFYASDAVNRKATKLFLNGVDVTSSAIFSDDVFLYSPKNFPRTLTLGLQLLKIELYDTSGALYHTVESDFNLSTATAIAEQESRLRAGIEGQAEYRRENIGSVANTFTRGNVRFNGTYKSLNFGSSILLTNEEQSDRQPQNRLLLYADLDFLKVQYGDAYPKFPSYIVSGKRVRGVSANLALGFFNVDVSFGKTLRNIEGVAIRDTTFADSSGLNARPENSVLKSGLFTYTLFTPGIFTRDFIAIRPSFGSGENFQWGFTYMKAKDDLGSIAYGSSPQENLVAGTDFLIAFDDQKFRLEGQASLGLLNKNISKGSFTQADYDKMAGKDDPSLTPQQRQDRQKDADDLKKLGDLASKFITINENLFPLNPVGTGLPGLSYEGILSLNYLNNFIRAQYYQRGAAYTSFGNEFLQSDIKGIGISDRIRMLQNRVLLSVSYENRKDNTAQTKRATTTYANLNSSITVYPGNNLPSFTFGYGNGTRSSDAAKTDSLFVADDATNRISLQVGHDFTWGARHNLSLGMSLADKKDNTFNKQDQSNNSFFGSLTTIYSIPLQTTVSLNINNTKSQLLILSPVRLLTPQEFKLTSLSVNAQYRMMNEKLRLACTVAPTFGDLKRTLVQLASDYALTENHSIVFQYDYIQNPAPAVNDNIISLVYRFNY
ncbi:MAG: hypothetical protein HY088_06235 [Ignavibacteriales bacterium]|nr:hypothetical protein [Ignavibacteriales bacterium]